MSLPRKLTLSVLQQQQQQPNPSGTLPEYAARFARNRRRRDERVTARSKETPGFRGDLACTLTLRKLYEHGRHIGHARGSHRRADGEPCQS